MGTTTTTTGYVAHNGRVHRASCKRVAELDAPELLVPEAVLLPPASCCKPQRSSEWKAWEAAVDAEQPTKLELVYRHDGAPRAKHFWIGSGREGAAAYAEATGCQLAVDNRTYTVTFTGARAEDAAELTRLAWDAAADQLPAWRASREADGYRGWKLRDRLAADRKYMRSWHAGAARELGGTAVPERDDAAELGAEWASALG